MSRSDWTCPEDRFPIMPVGGMARPRERLLTVPLAVVEEHAAQAYRNHSQTVARLKERGGLSWCELCAVLEDRPYEQLPVDTAHEVAMNVVLNWMANRP